MCSSCLFIYFLDMDELKLINSFKDDLLHLGYGHLIVNFLEMIMVLKEILQAQNVGNE